MLACEHKFTWQTGGAGTEQGSAGTERGSAGTGEKSAGAQPGRILIGTSGWSYAHWREIFYPREVAARDYLSFYATQFPTVEVNSSFYHLPSEISVARWVNMTPGGFCFAVKASRYITHRLRLRECSEPLAVFLRLARGFGPKLGPILFQLPPGLHRDDTLLADFLALLPPDLRIAIEFRHPSWYEDAIFTLLSSRGIALCLHDLRGSAAPSVVTARFVYVRFHGPHQAYTGSYNEEQLAAWAERTKSWAEDGHDVYVYFNNDIGGYAVKNARELQALVS